jgi:hypothetical protein
MSSLFPIEKDCAVNVYCINNQAFAVLVMMLTVINAECCHVPKKNARLDTNLDYSRIMEESIAIFVESLFENLWIRMFILIELVISIYVLHVPEICQKIIPFLSSRKNETDRKVIVNKVILIDASLFVKK